ncbi:low choriolytic enzyme isoform X2 [Myripristis murdjan]|uniref:low choriolytic enzyme isoform X2 n=1 Tax=Myripristis murdjan TaxID=586833 RepID=UPI001175F590|nr:low choriolytic enzyme-like isoform X2 [Myripristis murdjan]
MLTAVLSREVIQIGSLGLYITWRKTQRLGKSYRNVVGATWPGVDIPYLISPEIESRRDDILSAMVMLSEHTCLSFHSRTNEPDYLHFINSQGCASYVGFIGGVQPVFVAPACRVGNICHEILHALGFHHEHTRADRGQYISILYQNIMKGKKRNFQVQNGNTFNLSYDLTSILHYGRHFFSVNNLPTIMSKKNEKAMGQRTYMSKLDIQRVRILYNCDAKENQTAGDWSQQNGPRHANAGRQNDNTTHHLPETRQDSRQNSTESASRHVSGSSATNTTSGFNQDDISTSPLLNSNTTSESHPSRM